MLDGKTKARQRINIPSTESKEKGRPRNAPKSQLHEPSRYLPTISSRGTPGSLGVPPAIPPQPTPKVVPERRSRQQGGSTAVLAEQHTLDLLSDGVPLHVVRRLAPALGEPLDALDGLADLVGQLVGGATVWGRSEGWPGVAIRDAVRVAVRDAVRMAVRSGLKSVTAGNDGRDWLTADDPTSQLIVVLFDDSR